MLARIRQHIILKWFKFLINLRKDRSIIDIFKSLNNAKKVLICMPKDQTEYKDATLIIDELIEVFFNAECIILLSDTAKQLDINPATGKFLTISQSELNTFGLPIKTFKRKLVSQRFDITVDLNKSFDFLSTYLCICSKAILKICFVHEIRDDFYNFQVRLDPDLNLLSQYQKFVRYLRAGMVNY